MYYGIEKSIKDTVIAILDRWSKNGGLVGSDTIPVYRNVNVILENGVATVSFEAKPCYSAELYRSRRNLLSSL